ncbi:MAG TPA: TonB-dependent receptor [Steroidobacteraceae bacterium]|nr:TonB-dependent receptor [Steroidobacteraceae bacterium]
MNTKACSLMLGCVVALCVTAPELRAQTQSATVSLEEVIVTARKRDETSLNVPVAVNVFTAAEIEAAGIEKPQDFIDLTPNMTMVQTQNQGTSFITVRGISQARNSEPSVAVVIDGVAMANPSQFNQELVDIESIQVLKGPQGALYGRNAIGGAILITSKQPTDQFEGKVSAGYDSGPGYRVGATLSGPVSDTLKFRLSASYMDTDGYIDNPFLHEEADPYEDLSARGLLVWEPSDGFRADLRAYVSDVSTQALYFNITESVNDTHLPVRVNNPGVNDRDMYGASLKLDWTSSFGTITSVTAYDKLEEILTGDQFNFLPIPESVLFQFFQADQAQHQFLDVDAVSQELRFTSPADRRARWIFGAYAISTDRFISTGNVIDIGDGIVPEVRHTPLTKFDLATNCFPPACRQFTFLADSQDNFAWAVFGDFSYDLTDKLEGSVALRYDNDERENTTETPAEFLPTPTAFPGQVRKHTWDELQPKVTLRYKPADDRTWYVGYSRGFRSGGFNQTGVGAANIAGIDDLFDKETADTYEAGFKGEFMDRRVATNLSVYYTKANGSYFFVFDPNTSTQNLGNLGDVDYMGLEAEIKAALTDSFDAYLGLGYTDSDIKQSDRDPNDVGNQAPLVSEYSVNLGLAYRHDLAAFGGATAFVRTDLDVTGPTWFYPDNFTERDTINVLNLRVGLDSKSWSVTAWAKNLTDEDYNAEWSPGPQFFPNPGYTNNFVFKALPRRWGVDLAYRF